MREKLIELHKVLCKSLHCNYDEFQCAMTIDTLITAENMIANGVTIQKWTPVTEPPKKSGFYLVCTVHEFYKTANIAKAHFRSGGFYGQGGHWSNVTHWMPLPELPKGGE